MPHLGPVSLSTLLNLGPDLISVLEPHCSALVELARLLEPRRIRRRERYGRGQRVGACHALCQSGGRDRYYP
jgi:hypothetical protein